MSIKNIKVISRNPDQYLRETKNDIHKVPRNYNPDLHPFQAVREYKLALNAVKLERVFAKPFVGSLTHPEGVTAMCRHPSKLSNIYTGTVDGQLKLWNLPQKNCEWTVQGHSGQVWSIISAPDGQSFFSVGNDKTIKRWSVAAALAGKNDLPQDTWLSDTIITGISHHRYKDEFITCGERVLLWDANTKSPKFSYDWSTSGDRNEASAVCVKFNHVESNLFASSDHANNIVLYDVRSKEVKKLKMTLRVNSLAWNPMEAFIITAGSEDYNCYSFDIRKMDKERRIVGIHEGHTSAVVDLDYSPTGKEFVSGSYDKSLRIFRVDEARSREVYHTKRMFKVNCALWSADNKYVLSGSSDHNVRIWKAVANEKMGVMRDRETTAINYAEELKRKYGNFPEMRRILRHRHLPKSIYHAKKEHEIIKNSQARKDYNRRKHSKPSKEKAVSRAKKAVIGLQDEDYSGEPSRK
ncbi:DDB1- and CUL4-associated factor 13 [Halocaridina rubra]|uniref:DDB1- and CUL4-associated factor 13 n=1 Tax=Halocaridina rubra TaxID=373956 RepID=A0AAN8WFJ3_HALRR